MCLHIFHMLNAGINIYGRSQHYKHCILLYPVYEKTQIFSDMVWKCSHVPRAHYVTGIILISERSGPECIMSQYYHIHNDFSNIMRSLGQWKGCTANTKSICLCSKLHIGFQSAHPRQKNVLDERK